MLSLWLKRQDTRDRENRPEVMKTRARVIVLEKSNSNLKLVGLVK